MSSVELEPVVGLASKARLPDIQTDELPAAEALACRASVHSIARDLSRCESTTQGVALSKLIQLASVSYVKGSPGI